MYLHRDRLKRLYPEARQRQELDKMTGQHSDCCDNCDYSSLLLTEYNRNMHNGIFLDLFVRQEGIMCHITVPHPWVSQQRQGLNLISESSSMCLCCFAVQKTQPICIRLIYITTQHQRLNSVIYFDIISS